MAAPVLKYGRKHQHGLNRVTALAMAAFHAGAVAALFVATPGAVLAALVLYGVAGMLGIGMGYHRLLTHRGYRTYRPVEYFLTWCGTLALEGGPVFWVATHRVHHQRADRDGDPHTPREGTWWAHAGWILSGDGLHHDAAVLAQYAPDLVARSGPGLALQVALDLERPRRARAAGLRRHSLRALGHLLSHHRRPPRHLARELRHAQVGIAAVRHARRLHQQLVGRAPHVRRGMAQQSSRAADQRAPRVPGYELDANWMGIRALQILGLAWDVKQPRLSHAPSHAVDDPAT